MRYLDYEIFCLSVAYAKQFKKYPRVKSLRYTKLVKCPGTVIDEPLNFKEHKSSIVTKLAMSVGIVKTIRNLIANDIIDIYITF